MGLGVGVLLNRNNRITQKFEISHKTYNYVEGSMVIIENIQFWAVVLLGEYHLYRLEE